MEGTIKYYDHNDVLRLTLNEYPYYTEFGDLKDWTWEFDQQYGKINSFRRAKQSYELLIGIASNFKEQHDILCDIFSADVLAGSPGRLEINEWSLQCYITEAEHAYALDLDRQIGYVVTSINSTWIRTDTKSYNGIPGGGGGDVDLGRDYSYSEGVLGRGYDYGYSVADSHYASIDLPGTGNGYEVLIYGPQVNPVIYLNNQPIQVNVTLTNLQRLQIVSNGSIKTIKILSASNVETDAFIYRDKDHSPFLQLGTHTDLTYGQIRFDFTTIERRSEPTWT